MDLNRLERCHRADGVLLPGVDSECCGPAQIGKGTRGAHPIMTLYITFISYLQLVPSLTPLATTANNSYHKSP